MSDLGLKAKLEADSSPYIGGMKAAQAATSALTGAASSLAVPLGVLGLSFAAFKSVSGIMEGLKGAMEVGKELKTQSSITGQNIRDLVILKKAYQENGMEAGSLTQTLSMLQTALGGVSESGEPTKHIFDQLGLSIDKLKGQSAVQQLDQIGKAISRLGDQESKMAATRAIFGRAGAQMLALFNNPNAIEEAARKAQSKADLYQKNAATFARVTNSLEAVEGKVAGMFAGLAETAAPALEGVLKSLEKINSVKIGQEVGKGVSEAVKLMTVAFGSGDLGDLLGLSLQVGVLSVLPAIEAALLNCFLSPVVPLQAGLDMARQKLSEAERSLFGNEDKIQRAALVDKRDQLEKDFKSGSANPHIEQDLVEARAAVKIFDDKNKIPKHKSYDEFKEENRQNNKEFLEDFSNNGLQEAKDQLAKKKAALRNNPNYKALSAGGASSAETAPGTGGISAGSLGNVKSTGSDGDKLAKIGLFVGAGSPANQYARETSQNTASLVKLFGQLNTKLSSVGAAPSLNYAT